MKNANIYFRQSKLIRNNLSQLSQQDLEKYDEADQIIDD